MIHAFYIPTPLEEYPESERIGLAKQRMNEYIDHSESVGYGDDKVPVASTEARSRMQRIRYCRALWNNDLDESRYDYLYQKVNKDITDKQRGTMQTVTLELPAKVRHIPIIRPKLESLVSKEMGRPRIKKIIAVDKDSVKRKLRKLKDDFLEKQFDKIRIAQQAERERQALLQAQQQLIQESAENPDLKELIFEIQGHLELYAKILANDSAITEEEAQTLQEYYEYSYKEFEENLMADALDEFYDRKRLRHLDNDCFEEQMITGEPIWYVDWQPGMTEPEVRQVRPDRLWYQHNTSAKFLSELDWWVEYIPMTYGQIVYKFGDELTEKDLAYLREMSPYQSQDAWYRTNLNNYPDGTPAPTWDNQDRLYAHNIDCFLVTWKEQVEVYALYKKNTKKSILYEETPHFVKYLTAEEVKKKTSTEAKRKRMERKGESIKKRYRLDKWQGYRLGGSDGVFVKVKKCPFQYRVEESLSDCPGPYIGLANNKYHKANSPIWETRDIQDLYNILHYQEELLVALSGVKGTIYDLSQMPTTMSPQEVMYYRKQGLAFIETLHKDGRPKKTSFNQFQTYDDTLSPAVGIITQIKESLKAIASEITGVQPQQQGQVANTDQVGTYKMALQQSNVTVERYYQILEELIEHRDTRLCNLFVYAYAEGKEGVYVLGKERQKILQIQKNSLKGEFRTVVNNGAKEREIMQMAKEVATQKMSAGQLDTSSWLALLDIDTMHEIRNMLTKYEDDFRNKMQQQEIQTAEQQKQAQMELQQMNMQMQQQLVQMQGQIELQLAQIKAQVDVQKEQMSNEVKMQELVVNKELKDKENETKMYSIDTERAVEQAYLEFQYTELRVNDQNIKTQMLIDRAQNKLKLIHNSRSKERIKD